MSEYNNIIDFSILVGKTLTEIRGAEEGSDGISFVDAGGDEYQMLHFQNCCENVYVYDIIGDVEDLIGFPITMAEEIHNADDPEDYDEGYYDSHTWTFYKLATVKGYVTIRWLGKSNGYYSESVAFIKYG